MSRKTFDERFAYGREGEIVVGRWLKARQVRFLALHQFRKGAGAPVIWTPEHGDSVSPDFMCWPGDGSCSFVECKRRRWNVVGGRRDREASVSPAHLSAYRRLATSTGVAVAIYFLMSTEPEGLYRVDVAGDDGLRDWDGDAFGGPYDPQVFFPLERLEHLASAADLEALPE